MPHTAPCKKYETEEHLHYLWHLEDVAGLKKVDGNYESELWKLACGQCPVTVALIDTGIDTGHPNLKGAVDEQVDFTPHIYGATYDPPDEALRELQAALSGGSPNPKDVADAAKRVAEELRSWSRRQQFDTDAVSGLAKNIDGFANAAKTNSKKIERAAKEMLRLVVGTGNGADDVGKDDTDGKGAGNPKQRTREGEVQDAGPITSVAMLGDAGVIDAVIAHLEDLNHKKDAQIIEDLRTLKADLSATHAQRVVYTLRDPSRFFGAHGTACAGLISGHPNYEEPSEPGAPSAIPYFGVNPYGRILPIATPYSHEIRPMIHALLHAYVSGAKVIHIPRGMPDYRQRGVDMCATHYATRIEVDNEETKVPEDQADRTRLLIDQAVFEAILKWISLERYVVLAAGNDGWRTDLSYPARLYFDGVWGTDHMLFVIGARNRRGYVSSYSNGAEAQRDILHMLSDDAFALNRRQVAYDRKSRGATDYDYTPHEPDGVKNTYSPWGLFTLDVRGSYGYAAGLRYDPPEYDEGLERSALYTIFGGTSGASSLAAGRISLLIQAGKIDADPKAALGDNPNLKDIVEAKTDPLPVDGIDSTETRETLAEG